MAAPSTSRDALRDGQCSIWSTMVRLVKGAPRGSCESGGDCERTRPGGKIGLGWTRQQAKWQGSEYYAAEPRRWRSRESIGRSVCDYVGEKKRPLRVHRSRFGRCEFVIL